MSCSKFESVVKAYSVVGSKSEEESNLWDNTFDVKSAGNSETYHPSGHSSHFSGAGKQKRVRVAAGGCGSM
ncbi:hypothetical protein OPQ81_000687 [Rhizoctonia solani]|nr:hypothetical protein OPQ81_000687 [Rhizoctonia solani]